MFTYGYCISHVWTRFSTLTLYLEWTKTRIVIFKHFRSCGPCFRTLSLCKLFTFRNAGMVIEFGLSQGICKTPRFLKLAFVFLLYNASPFMCYKSGTGTAGCLGVIYFNVRIAELIPWLHKTLLINIEIPDPKYRLLPRYRLTVIGSFGGNSWKKKFQEDINTFSFLSDL